MKHSVETLFSRTGAGLILLKKSDDADAIINTFDHPELLEVWTEPLFGQRFIIHSRDRLYFERRAKAGMALMERMGITPERFERMTVKQIRDLSALTTQEMSREIQ